MNIIFRERVGQYEHLIAVEEDGLRHLYFVVRHEGHVVTDLTLHALRCSGDEHYAACCGNFWAPYALSAGAVAARPTDSRYDTRGLYASRYPWRPGLGDDHDDCIGYTRRKEVFDSLLRRFSSSASSFILTDDVMDAVAQVWRELEIDHATMLAASPDRGLRRCACCESAGVVDADGRPVW